MDPEVGLQLQQVLIEAEVISEEAMGEAQRISETEARSLAEVLTTDFALAEDTLADAVARAIGSVVIEVQLGALDADSVRLIPEEDARRHLMVAVARDPNGRRLRVAFANPLDQDALAAARDITDLEVDPMVATISGVRATIDREYRKRSTQVIRDRRSSGSEMKDEVTQQITSPPGSATEPVPGPPGTAPRARAPGSRTSPMHRLEQDATIEQRHEALLLALVEAGVITRSDYVAALKRLLGHRET